jgi:hypothetical protein
MEISENCFLGSAKPRFSGSNPLAASMKNKGPAFFWLTQFYLIIVRVNSPLLAAL